MTTFIFYVLIQKNQICFHTECKTYGLF